MTTDAAPPQQSQPAPEPSGFPLDLTIRHPEHQRLLTNIPIIGSAIRYVLVIPSVLLVGALSYATLLAYSAATFVILFTGRYPRGLFKLIVGTIRWQLNNQAYILHLFDDYPPLDLDQRPDAWVQFAVGYPARPSRLLNSPILGLLIKAVLLIPQLILIYFLTILAAVVALVATVAISFSGRYPLGLHGFVAGVIRWQARITAYFYGLSDVYPPFSLS